MKKIVCTAMLLMASVAAYLQSDKPANFEAGRKVYNQACLSCHMTDGMGVPGLNPPLAKTDWVTGDKARLINVILLGLNEPIKIEGEEYANPMPAQPQLTDQQIADVLTYIRNSFGNKASATTVDEVKKQRAKLKK